MNLTDEQNEAIAKQQAHEVPTRRTVIPALEAIMYHPFPVLDEGFIRVVDYMGGDESVIRAARVSFGKGTKRVSDDKGLIRYLMRNYHTTPFEMAEIVLHVRVPMDAWRQWIRHRTASVNEYSTRYSIAIDMAQETAPDQWRLQAGTNKQGSEGLLDIKAGDILTLKEKIFHGAARDLYQERLEHNVAREQARKDLPLSTYTEAYWKIDLHNMLNFLWRRMDGHAQLEIREYATIIGEQIVARWVPFTWQAFLDYRLHATHLSAQAHEVVRRMLQGEQVTQENSGLSMREWNELMEQFPIRLQET
ncbi:MAG: Thymidylate synthase ThyX [Microgenomates bacterium OLB22]|nr:MAG: Thymidylate synthase ThyX [Microgenomates bacterium OLB22]